MPLWHLKWCGVVCRWATGEEEGEEGARRASGGCERGVKGVLVVKIGFHPPAYRYV